MTWPRNSITVLLSEELRQEFLVIGSLATPIHWLLIRDIFHMYLVPVKSDFFSFRFWHIAYYKSSKSSESFVGPIGPTNIGPGPHDQENCCSRKSGFKMSLLQFKDKTTEFDKNETQGEKCIIYKLLCSSVLFKSQFFFPQWKIFCIEK